MLAQAVVVQTPPDATVEPPAVEALDAGVINDARARQRQQWAVVVVVLALVVGAIVLASGGIGGSSATAPGSRHFAPAAGKGSRASLTACLAPAQAFTKARPGTALLSMLGVLRRPAVAGDAPANLRQALTARPVWGQVFVNYIRRARVISGVPYYVMPVRYTACRGHAPIGLQSIVLWVGPRGYAAGAAATIEQAGMFDQTLRLSGVSTIDMIVPDGVASVTLRYPAGQVGGYDPNHAPAFNLTIRIVGNLLVATIPRAGNSLVSPMTMIWRAANGRIIKTFDGLEDSGFQAPRASCAKIYPQERRAFGCPTPPQ